MSSPYPCSPTHDKLSTLLKSLTPKPLPGHREIALKHELDHVLFLCLKAPKDSCPHCHTESNVLSILYKSLDGWLLLTHAVLSHIPGASTLQPNPYLGVSGSTGLPHSALSSQGPLPPWRAVFPCSAVSASPPLRSAQLSRALSNPAPPPTS